MSSQPLKSEQIIDEEGLKIVLQNSVGKCPSSHFEIPHLEALCPLADYIRRNLNGVLSGLDIVMPDFSLVGVLKCEAFNKDQCPLESAVEEVVERLKAQVSVIV